MSIIKIAELKKIAESVREKFLNHTIKFPTIRMDGYKPTTQEIINTVQKELTPAQIQKLYANPDSQDSKVFMNKIAESLEFRANSKKKLWEVVEKIINEM